MNPFEQFSKDWDNLSERVDRIAAKIEPWDADVVQSMAMLRQEVYKLASDLELLGIKVGQMQNEIMDRLRALTDTVDSHHGQYTLPTHSAIEGVKGSLRNYDSAIAGLVSKVSEHDAEMARLKGAVARG